MVNILATKKLPKALKKKFADAKIVLVEKNFIQTKSISFETPQPKDYFIFTSKQAVKSVVMTMRGEKPFRPLFGTEAQVALFENFDPILADDITLSIEDALKVFEPRVKVINIDYLDNIDDNSVDITINYEIVGLPLNQQSLNLILERV